MDDYSGSYSPALWDQASSWGTSSAPASSSSGTAWWEDTLQFVIKAAAVDRYSPKPVQQTGQYQLDQYGNLVPMGSGIQITGQTSVPNNTLMYAALALGAVLLFTVMKD